MALGFRLHALFELLQRYSRVWGHAWRHRDQEAGPPKQRLTNDTGQYRRLYQLQQG